MFIKRTSLILIISWACGTAVAQSYWDAFLRSPDPGQFAVLKSKVEAVHGCDRTVQPNERDLHALLRLVETGNQSAARAAILILQCAGVGDSEDINRSLGSFAEAHAGELLEIAVQGGIPDDRLRHIISMLPLSLVDDVDGQIAEIDKRIGALQRVSDVHLTRGRSVMLSALEDEKKVLVRARADKGKSR